MGHQFPKIGTQNVMLTALHGINLSVPQAREDLILLQAQRHLPPFIIQLKMCEIAS